MRLNAPTLSRRLFASAAFALALGLSAAQAATPAETYIGDNVQKGLAILNNPSLSVADKQAQFQSFLESLTDIHRIAVFTLGPAAVSAPPADVDAFVQAFRGYAAAVYQEQLAHYSGQTLKVTGSIQHAPGDVIVQTVVQDPNEPGRGDEVDFRVADTNGKMQVIDASVSGVWLA
ncbi:MAG: ABC transporter substrate-binding protein, partial [Proteobacteria bacterium]|nr:ABC transporter substrate-binding protein [Pseudomonadota bacterium]